AESTALARSSEDFPLEVAGRDASWPMVSRPVTALASHQLDLTDAGRFWHAILEHDLPAADRHAGDALCRPANRFWSLSIPCLHSVTCPSCLARAAMFGVTVPGGAR